MEDRRPPTVPDYGGACIDQVVAAALRNGPERGSPPHPAWLPEPAVAASQVVLLVLDGLGWEQLQERPGLAPTLTAMTGGPVTTVAPSTTAAALTSITIGAPPATHGVIGYRVRAPGDGVLNILRWRTPAGDARAAIPPEEFQTLEPFRATKPPVVTRAELAESGFTRAHMSGARVYGWRMPSTLVATVAALLGDGERFVYAYYDGVDKVAHEYGLRDGFFPAELASTDRLVGDLLAALPRRAALVLTSDHGQVQFEEWCTLEAVASRVTGYAGDGRFRYLYARPGAEEDLMKAAEDLYGDQAWVLSRSQLVDEGWLGLDPPAGDVLPRLGDVALAARGNVAFADPTHPQELKLVAGHGSLTADEMLVPLLAGRGQG